MLTLSSIFTGLAVLVALFALWRARAAAKRIERLSESYWELRYETGQLKARVTRLEVEIADYEAALSNFKSAEETIRVSELLTARRADLDALMSEWEQVAELIEANQ